MYYVSAAGRVRKMIYETVNRYLSEGEYLELGSANIDSHGKLTIEIVRGFDRQEKLEPHPDANPDCYGGGILEAANGKKFRIDITEIQ